VCVCVCERERERKREIEREVYECCLYEYVSLVVIYIFDSGF